jgi:hypothetical protein
VRTLALAALCGGCGGDDAPKKAAPPRLDTSSPRALAQSLFAIARHGNLTALSGIAAPEVASRGVKDLEEISKATPEEQQEFRNLYASGTVTGEKIHAENAEVDVRIGRDGKKGGNFKMVKLGERWLLKSL